MTLGFFRNLGLNNKGGKDHLKALDLKMAFLGDDKSLILALVSLWLLVNSIKKENPKQKRPIDFFDYFTKRYFLLLYYYFSSFYKNVRFHFNRN